MPTRVALGTSERPLNWYVRPTMFNFAAAAHLRYVLLLTALTGLAPALLVKGRENDPLLRAPWWTTDQHSGVLVVVLTAVIGTVLVYVIRTRGATRWWHYSLCGAAIGAIPGAFYLIATPGADLAGVPLSSMLLTGITWGGLIGVVIYAAVGRSGGKTWV
jgi:hypothetical protein